MFGNTKKIYIKTLTHQVKRITNSLNSKSGGQFTSEINLLNIPKDNQLFDNTYIDNSLQEITKDIKQNQLIGKSNVNAFLATVIPDCLKKQNEYLIIQGRLFLIAYSLHSKNGYEDVIERAFREYRLFVCREDWDLLDQLPDFSLPVDELINKLEKIRETKPLNTATRILTFVSLLKQYKGNSPDYKKRKVSKQKQKVVSSPQTLETIENLILADEDETSFTEVITYDVGNKSNYIDESERFADQIQSARYFKFNLIAPEAVKESLSLQHTAAKSAANHIQRKEKLLSTDLSKLTSKDISELIKHCLEKLYQDPHYCCLLVMLFSGKNLEETLDFINNAKTNNKSKFKNYAVSLFKPDLPEHIVATKLEEHIRRSKGYVITAIPEVIKDCIVYFHKRFSNLSNIQKDAESTLKIINKKSLTNLTLARITNYIVFYLNNLGVDPTEISLITGKGLHQNAGTYYYQVNVGDLLALHQSYINYLLSQFGIKEFNDFSTSTEQLVGSQLIIKQETILSLFDKISIHLNAFRNERWRDTERFHNLYVIYCIQLLNIATGHRPVRDPYDDIYKFDLVADLLLISDKEERPELAARVIPLPSIVSLQVKSYLDHLKIISSQISDISHKSGEAINRAIKGKEPLFFFLENYKTESVSPKTLSFYLEDKFPFPLNWHRHFMRTWLRKQGFNGQLVNAWMGHLSNGNSGFSRYSGLSSRDLKKISESINHFLVNEIKIKNEKPWSIL